MKKLLVIFIILIFIGIIFYSLNSYFSETMEKLIVKSAFAEGEKIPEKYTCNGENVNPPLEIEGIPSNAKTLAIIVDDPDATGGWVHWIVFNIPVTSKIEENSVPGEEGMNDFKQTSYSGPCPPSGSHRYYFRVYSLDVNLSLSFATKADLEMAMKGHILAKGELMGRFR